MNKEFVLYELAVKLKEKGFEEDCLAHYTLHGKQLIIRQTEFTYQGVILAPLYQQVVDWFETKHNLHIDRIWYDDKVTPARWVYHVEHQYAGSDYDKAIDEAIKLVNER
jgi:hypothetical protein